LIQCPGQNGQTLWKNALIQGAHIRLRQPWRRVERRGLGGIAHAAANANHLLHRGGILKVAAILRLLGSVLHVHLCFFVLLSLTRARLCVSSLGRQTGAEALETPQGNNDKDDCERFLQTMRQDVKEPCVAAFFVKRMPQNNLFDLIEARLSNPVPLEHHHDRHHNVDAEQSGRSGEKRNHDAC